MQQLWCFVVPYILIKKLSAKLRLVISKQLGDKEWEFPLLQTAKLVVKGNPSSTNFKEARVILDLGSQRSYITSNLKNNLGPTLENWQDS